MEQLSLQALHRACLAVLGEHAATERTLQDMDPKSDDAYYLSDDLVQLMKIECELRDAYRELQAASEVRYPTWEEMVASTKAS